MDSETGELTPAPPGASGPNVVYLMSTDLQQQEQQTAAEVSSTEGAVMCKEAKVIIHEIVIVWCVKNLSEYNKLWKKIKYFTEICFWVSN